MLTKLGSARPSSCCELRLQSVQRTSGHCSGEKRPRWLRTVLFVSRLWSCCSNHVMTFGGIPLPGGRSIARGIASRLLCRCCFRQLSR